MRDVVFALGAQYGVVLSSGRPEEYRAVTEEWLGRHGVSYQGLYMRPTGDTRADHIVKAEMLTQIRADGFDPFIVIDDRPSVVAMWRENGLVCLQVAAGDEPMPDTARLTLMVGPSGGGKSVWLRSASAAAMGILPSQIISSDEVRADLCGNFMDQSRNQ